MSYRRSLRLAVASIAVLVLSLSGGGVASAADPAGAGHAPTKAPPPSVDGRTPRTAAPGAAAATTAQYFYGAAYQYGQSDGAWGHFTVTRPTVAPTDAHSLAEMMVETSDGQSIVEVGYTVDRQVNGDLNPHLFVFHWVNGIATCYNGCGFVQTSANLRPGMALAVGSSHQLTVRHFAGNWWIGDTLEWIGYFPDSLWGGAFTKAGLVQWFGEVAASTTASCTDMGNGRFASSRDSAIIRGIGYWAGPPLNLTAEQLTPGLYTASVEGGNNLRYGGPGAC